MTNQNYEIGPFSHLHFKGKKRSKFVTNLQVNKISTCARTLSRPSKLQMHGSILSCTRANQYTLVKCKNNASLICHKPHSKEHKLALQKINKWKLCQQLEVGPKQYQIESIFTAQCSSCHFLYSSNSLAMANTLF